MAESSRDQLLSEFKPAVFPVDIFNVPDLDVYEQMVFIVLHSYCNAHTNVAFPFIKTIAKQARMSERKVKYCIQGLVSKGLLVVEEQFKVSKAGKVSRTSNRYILKNPAWVVHTVHEGVVHDVHEGGAQDAPGVMHDVHGKESISNQSSSTQSKNNRRFNKQSEKSQQDERYKAFYDLFPEA